MDHDDMDRDHTRDWRELCRAAANEPDPAKLMSLIAELTKALEERDKKRRTTTGGILNNPNNTNKDAGARSLRKELAA